MPHLKRSRIAKTMTDRADSIDYEAAEQRLSNVSLSIVVSAEAASSVAGQAAALTAVATGMKCFERVNLCGTFSVPLCIPIPLGATIEAAAKALGAQIVSALPACSTHVVFIGPAFDVEVFAVRCWWDKWIGGALPQWDDRPIGESTNPLAGIVAGAMAIREVFATVLGDPRTGKRPVIFSLWEPWNLPTKADSGPTSFYIPKQLWIIGLGHLGQGVLWSLGMLPAAGTLAVLQDDQFAGEENEATGLLTSVDKVGQRKTRIAAEWLEAKGWDTSILERRHHGDIKLEPNDPPIVITGLDDPVPRVEIAGVGFEYMIDVGVGHGSRDFESLQIRVLCPGDDARKFWAHPSDPKNVDALLALDAYQKIEKSNEVCGAFSLASASVAVPFVGAIVGALVIAQAIRLTCMRDTCRMLQMDLGSPELVTSGDMVSLPRRNLGGVAVQLPDIPLECPA